MALCVAGEVTVSNVKDVPFVDITGCNGVDGDEVAQPLGGILLSLVVVSARHSGIKKHALVGVGRGNDVGVHDGRMTVVSAREAALAANLNRGALP